MQKLHQMKCQACEGGTAPLTKIEEETYLAEIPNWEIDRSVSIHIIHRHFVFANFLAAMSFLNRVADIAESEGHHPDFTLHDYKHVDISLHTHAIKGLSVNDFIVASKIDRIEL